MNIEELRTFIAIVQTRSLVGASRRLHVTQSTVTARMNTLEEEVGQRLLHRGKGGAELTSPGFKFLRYAELMIQLWGRARHEVSLPPTSGGLCNIGLEFDLWTGLTERFVEDIQGDERRITASVWPAERVQLNRWLRTGLIDIAFCYNSESTENFSNRVIVDDEIILVSTINSSDNKLDASYIFVDHGAEVRRQHAESYPDHTPSLIVASSEWVLGMLLRRRGSGYLPARIAAEALRDGRLFAVEGAPRFKRRVYLVESLPTVRHWGWYEEAVNRIFPGAPIQAVSGLPTDQYENKD
jgi:LysR family transcriptional regulator, flagellar master operon regulator